MLVQLDKLSVWLIIGILFPENEIDERLTQPQNSKK